MPKSRSTRAPKRKTAAVKAGRPERSDRRGAARVRSPRARVLMSRLSVAPATRGSAATTRAASNRADAGVPQAIVSRGGGPVVVEIAFGHAQHGTYAIQLFDPQGVTELTRETGLSTDAVPDRFQFAPAPAQLDQHLVQWSGAVDAFSAAPGQQFSVIFDVTQNGRGVPGGHVEKTGPLTITQAFLGLLRLVMQ